MTLELIASMLKGHAGYFDVLEDATLVEILKSDTPVPIKLENIKDHIDSSDPIKSHHEKLRVSICNLQKDIVDFGNRPPEDTVIGILASKYVTFVDTYVLHIRIKECDPIGFRKCMMDISDVTFDRTAVERAMRLKDVFITSNMTDQVLQYLLMTTNDDKIQEKALSDIIDESKSQSTRYIHEMTIEYNQIEDRQELVSKYEQGESLAAILETLKGNYHSTWRNERDFEWIAKDEPDYDSEYASLHV